MNKIAIIGCGNVGMAYGYALITSNASIDELVLIDIDTSKAQGEALDLQHSAVFKQNKCKIYAGTYADCNDANIAVICAGRNQDKGETRSQLIDKNFKIFQDVIFQLKTNEFNGIYLVATNPLDVMTYVTYRLSGAPHNKVIGSGTILDSARLRSLISNKTDIDPDNIHAYVIGEHGDSEMIPWSLIRIGLNNVEEFINKQTQDAILEDVRQSAYKIINLKGNTAYGIGVCLVKITEAILNDDNTILTVSSYNQEKDVYLGYPTIINSTGALKQIELTLNKEEQEELNNSIKKIKENISNLNL